MKIFKRKLKKKSKMILSILAISSLGIASILITTNKKGTEENKIIEVKDISTQEVVTELDKLQATVNKEIIGFFTFEQNTNHDTKTLPVILTEGDYYMTHDAFGNKDGCGAVFIDKKEVSDESNNIIVYGHSSLKKDCNFTFFKSYKEKTYFNQNEFFTYTNENNETKKYQILFMSMIDLESSEGAYLDWYNSYFHSTDEFIEVLNKTSEYAVTDKRGFTLNEDDNILTLVTCDMSKKDARFVLFAKEV
ncbi:MAG: class B sortase [Erysipelotrichaceae bacterium]|nr:class B sortase [Erysipelotrichaceae bacterium]